MQTKINRADGAPVKVLMLFVIGILLCLSTLCHPYQAQAAAKMKYPNTGYVNTDGKVKLYKQKSESSKALKKLKPNTKIKFQKIDAKWSAVKYQGKKGYMLLSQITTRKPLKCKYTPSYFRRAGVIRWSGWNWMWYSQNVLPGGGLRIPGRHVDPKGYVCDKDNNICLASSDLPYGTVVKTPLGKYGKIYDSGCDHGVLDVYVAW